VFIDPELRDFAKGTGSSRRSVIVEAITNPVSVPARLRSPSAPRPGRAAASPPIDEHAAFDALGSELRALDLAAEPVRMEGIGTFVVELTAEQVRRVLELPMVAAVRLNRTHQLPRRAGR
jgi:hypothetical protein